MRRPRRLVPLAIAVAALGALPTAAAARMSIFYDEKDPVRVLTDPSGPGAPIDAERGAFRQDPGSGGIFDPAGRDDSFRIAKISASEISGLAPEALADRIQDEIDDPEIGNSSGLVAIDEIGNTFNDGRARISYSWKSVRGTRIRVASHNRLVVTRTGYRIAKGAAPLPVIDPAGPGSRLSVAMEILDGRPYPSGGSYADRVHLYIAPAFSTSIAAGRGPHRHLGKDGKPHRATWRGVMPALARAGGVWLEMYHHSRGRGVYPMTAREWRTVPSAMSGYAAGFGADATRMHLVMSAAGSAPAGARACGAPMQCQWALAGATPAGAAMLRNGPGAYRLAGEAGAWRAEYNRVFGGS